MPKHIPLTANVYVKSGSFAGKYGRYTGSKHWSTIQNCYVLDVEIGRKGRTLLLQIPEFRLERFAKERNDIIAEFGEYVDAT